MVLEQLRPGQVRLGFPAEDVATQTLIDTVASVAVQIDPEAVDRLMASYERVHTLGILDPTAYRDTMGALQERQRHVAAFRRYLEAALAFRDAVMADREGE